MHTARLAAGLAAIAVTGAAVLVTTLTPAVAAPAGPAPVAGQLAPTSTANGTRTLVLDQSTDLPADGAKINVRGSGFDPDHGLYVAVCAGSGTPADLSKCVGGAIPDANPTQGWAHVTDLPADGKFSVTLTLPSVTGDPNCVTGGCSLYTTSDDATVRSEDNAVPLTFTAPASASSTPPPSSSSTPTSPTSPTSATAPSTAVPELIASPSVVAGGNQIVVFSGFQAGEQVALTLFSAEVQLPTVTASSGGVARTEFTVPADLAVGTHRLQAIGQTSGIVGVASFQVTAPPVSSASSTPPSSTPPSSTPSSTPSSSSAASRSSAPASSAVTSSSAAAGGTSSDSTSSLWWLWVLIAIVVIAGIVTGVIVWQRNRQRREREEQERELAAVAAQEQAVTAGGAPPGADAPTVMLPPVPPPTSGPPPGQDPYGLLSGRDHPDNPSLYSGYDAGPTQVLGPDGGQSGQPGGGQPGSPPEYGGSGAPTQAIGPTGSVPESGSVPPDGPPTGPLPPVGPLAGQPPAGGEGTGTASWTPDFDDTDSGGPAGAGRGGDGPGGDGRGGGGGSSGDRPDQDEPPRTDHR